MPNPTDRETLRKLLSAVLPTDSDLEALCIDHFPSTAKRFSIGMDRVGKTNLLFQIESPEEILAALQSRDPARYARQQQLLNLAQSPMAQATDSAAISSQKSQPVPSLPVAARAPVVQPPPGPSEQPHADVVIITALKDDEYDEAYKVEEGAIGDWITARIEGTAVAFRDYQAADGQPLRIAMTWATRMRGTAAADVAGRLVDKLGAGCVAMCGVCAGRRGKVQPGDVIIADLVYRYDTGALRVEYDPHGGSHERFQADPDPFPLAEAMLHRARAFRVQGAPWIHERPLTLAAQCDWVLAQLNAGQDPVNHAEVDQKCPAWTEAFDRLKSLHYVTERPGADMQLQLTDEGTAYIRGLLLRHRRSLPTAPPWRPHIAPIATGGSVMRDPKLFDRLSDSMRNVLGVEMEAASIAATAHARNLPWVIMKGVMDHADHDKDDLLKRFAARASAECLIRFLRENPPRATQRFTRNPAGSPTNRSAGIIVTPALRPTSAAAAQPGKALATPLAVTPLVQRDPATVHAEPRDIFPLSSPALDRLKEEVRAVLQDAPELAMALAKVGYGVTSLVGAELVESVWVALSQRPVADVAIAITKLAKQSNVRDSARRLLCHILPLAAPWQSLVEGAASAGGSGTALELPLQTATIAEVVMAHLDARCCEFTPGRAYPQGTRNIPMPSVAHAALFDPQGSVMADAVVNGLWQERNMGDAPLPDVARWRAIKSDNPSEHAFRIATKAEIKVSALLDKPRYLLFIDGDLDPQGVLQEKGELDAAWKVQQQALQKQLPGLRLVRLKGRTGPDKDQQHAEEIEIAICVREVHPS